MPACSNVLSYRYHSLAEIAKDTLGPGLAFAQDMGYVDWLNYQMKNFIIRQRLLNQVVSINIDGDMVDLTNPDTAMPLLYGDFITDRSGPKFGGYLDETCGEDYLPGNVCLQEVEALIERQQQATLSYCQKKGLPLPDPETLKIATSIFRRKHPSQRKLSDFDLTAREIGLLERAILNKVSALLPPAQREKLQRSPQLKVEIGKTAWRLGGMVKTSVIIATLNDPEPSICRSYKDRVLETLHVPGEHGFHPQVFSHMLISGVGKVVRAEYLNFYSAIGEPAPVFYLRDSSAQPDTYYGLGIPFVEALISEVSTLGKFTLSTEGSDTEIGDIICDNSSIFGHVFNPNIHFQKICFELKTQHDISASLIAQAVARATKDNPEQHKVFEQALALLSTESSLSPAQRLAAEKALTQYLAHHQFMETGLIFEEAGKKEGQSQLFKLKSNKGKLIGNISDTAIFLDQARQIIDDPSLPASDSKVIAAKAHMQMATLTTLFSVTRWGIKHTNHTAVGNTHDIISAKEFQQSLNQRSYTLRDTTGIREQLKLSNITEDEAQQRLDSYQHGFEPIWQFIREKAPFFELIKDYSIAKSALLYAHHQHYNQGIIHARQEKLSQSVQQLSSLY